MESKMSQKDEPFQDEEAKKSEKEKNESESFNTDLPSDEDDDIIDLLDSSGESDVEEILELKETVDDEDILDLAEEADMTAGDDEDFLELVEEADMTADEDGDIPDLAEETDITAGENEEDFIDLTSEADEDLSDQGKAADITDEDAVKIDEDKQILELIDDIQSTLDETEEKEIEEPVDGADQVPLTDDTAVAIDDEEPLENTMLLGDEESVETDDLSESESEFVDSLGLDLTAELSKEMFSEDSEASALLTEKIENAVEQVIERMLSDENSSLVKAIQTAVKKGID
jgi:hypothetical protein